MRCKRSFHRTTFRSRPVELSCADRFWFAFCAVNTNAAAYAKRVTVLEVIQRSTEFLTRKGVESPRLQTELLLAHVLRMPRMQLYLNFERELNVEEQDRLRLMVKRRGDREPVQHILGLTSFCGLEMEVTRAALVPRPETELLAEQGWTFLNRRAREAGDTGSGEPTALDFGTGTGCIAIAMAVNCPRARVVALEKEPDAIELAQKNIEHHQLARRIQIVHGDRLGALGSAASFDVIVANPPYIPSAEIDHLEPEVQRFDPRSALDGGPDGLIVYRHLAREAGLFLKPAGRLMIEFGDEQEGALQALFESEKWIVESVIKDYTQRPRLLVAHKTM
jgi:release factor glutamine methyltransferase